MSYRFSQKQIEFTRKLKKMKTGDGQQHCVGYAAIRTTAYI